MKETLVLSIEQLDLLETILKENIRKCKGQDFLSVYKKLYSEMLSQVQSKLYVIQEPEKTIKKEYLKPSLVSKKVIDTPKMKQHAFEAMLASLPL